jgi:hypothetical protein
MHDLARQEAGLIRVRMELAGNGITEIRNIFILGWQISTARVVFCLVTV